MVRLSIVALRTEKKHLEALWKLMRHEAERTWSPLTRNNRECPTRRLELRWEVFRFDPSRPTDTNCPRQMMWNERTFVLLYSAASP